MSNPLIVYFAFSSTKRPEHESVLLDLKPKSLMSQIIKNKSNENNNHKIQYPLDIASPGYHVCPALYELTDNTYIIKSPFSIHVKFDENNIIDRSQGLNTYCFTDRFGSFQDSVSADFLYDFFLFSEESINVSFTPPYMNNTRLSQYGFMSCAKMNISKWFRPIPFIFHSWPNMKEFFIQEGEPLMYINFEGIGKRKVIFKEFIETDTIKKISNAVVTHKDIKSFLSMEKLYNIFDKTSMKNRLLKEIIANLVD